MTTRQRLQSDGIVDAAMRVLYRDGFPKMTIDSIAAEAGMTKGGVFYYFKNKNDILSCIVERYEELYNARRDEMLNELPEDQPGRFLRATVLASLEYYDETKDNIQNVIGMYTDETFRKTVRALKQRTFEQLSRECRHPEKLTMILFALDGMWMDRIVGESIIPPACMEEFRQSLLEYVDQVAKECD